jgi:hypothetical protein
LDGGLALTQRRSRFVRVFDRSASPAAASDLLAAGAGTAPSPTLARAMRLSVSLDAERRSQNEFNEMVQNFGRHDDMDRFPSPTSFDDPGDINIAEYQLEQGRNKGRTCIPLGLNPFNAGSQS